MPRLRSSGHPLERQTHIPGGHDLPLSRPRRKAPIKAPEFKPATLLTSSDFVRDIVENQMWFRSLAVAQPAIAWYQECPFINNSRELEGDDNLCVESRRLRASSFHPSPSIPQFARASGFSDLAPTSSTPATTRWPPLRLLKAPDAARLAQGRSHHLANPPLAVRRTQLRRRLGPQINVRALRFLPLNVVERRFGAKTWPQRSV